MTGTFPDLLQGETWQTASVNRPVSALSLSEAVKALAWLSGNAENFAQGHDTGGLSAEEWVLNTPLAKALAMRHPAASNAQAEAIGLADSLATIEQQLTVEKAKRADAERAAAASAGAGEQAAEAAVGRARQEFDARLAEARQRLAAERKAADDASQVAANLRAELDEVAAGREALTVELAAAQAALDQACAAHAARTADDKDTQIEKLSKAIAVLKVIVFAAVGILVYWGGVVSASRYGRWPDAAAALVPLAIELGVVMELLSARKRKLRGVPSHWSLPVLTIGLLGMSIAGLLLHATDADPDRFPGFAYAIACWLPFEVMLLVVADQDGKQKDAADEVSR